MSVDEKTILYYERNAGAYIRETVNVDFSDVQNKFLSLLPEHCKILDFGCGSGRDTKYFMDRGYAVDAVDGSEELCKLAGKFTGIKVKHMLFSELSEVDQYDGIWACSSILHLSAEELKSVLNKMIRALKENGIIYTSFKYGEFDGYRNERYFIDFTEYSFTEFVNDITEIKINEYWISEDVRPGRGEEKWLNLILQKKVSEKTE